MDIDGFNSILLFGCRMSGALDSMSMEVSQGEYSGNNSYGTKVIVNQFSARI